MGRGGRKVRGRIGAVGKASSLGLGAGGWKIRGKRDREMAGEKGERKGKEVR